ncbi:uncharacterized protein LOC133441059 [Cololabis saira]|uniref:uncharacterized protein LOC133441059 n=1 Tax=Cololabis saira TaxID=129043 RepID=UPI002AD24FE3|nr:uncharacterized protein LOC133441059 [Cololabis saira]
MKTISWFGIVLCALSAAGKVFFTKVEDRVILECGVSSFQDSLEWKHGANMVLKEVMKQRFPARGCHENRLTSALHRTSLYMNISVIIFNKSNMHLYAFSGTGSKPITTRSRIKRTNLQITGVKEEDAGAFTCLVDGKSHQHKLVVVSVGVKPPGVLLVDSTAVVHCRVNNLDQGSTVRLLRPDGSETALQTELKPVTVSHDGTWMCNVTNDGETFSARLVISVKDPAPKTSPPSSLITTHQLCPSCGGSEKLLGLSWWMWVALGVGFLVVIVLITSVIVTCKRVRRRKRKFLHVKNGQLQQRNKQYCQCKRQTAAAKPQQGRRREKPSALPLQPLLKE